MSESIEYRIDLDEAYLVTALLRVRELKPGGRRQRWMKWVIGPLFLGFGALGLGIGGRLAGLTLLLMGALTILGERLDNALAGRKLRKSPHFGTELHIVLGASGLQVTDEETDSKLDWKLFSRARGFDDGILLDSVEGHARWLPSAALVSGTQAEAGELLRAKLADFADVRWRKRVD